MEKESFMKSKYVGYLILINLVLVLFFFNKDVMHKEDTLQNGQLILLKLRPLDPRSLMQGDYMRLRYRITSNIYYDDIPKRGYLVLSVDENKVGHKIRFQKDINPLQKDEQILHYYYGERAPVLGAESYFFEEGSGSKYDSAAYGGIITDQDGNGILTGLYDKDFKKIE